MSDNAAVTRALNAARARTCFDPSVRSPDRLGSRAPLQAHFWIGKDYHDHIHWICGQSRHLSPVDRQLSMRYAGRPGR